MAKIFFYTRQEPLLRTLRVSQDLLASKKKLLRAYHALMALL